MTPPPKLAQLRKLTSDEVEAWRKHAQREIAKFRDALLEHETPLEASAKLKRTARRKRQAFRRMIAMWNAALRDVKELQKLRHEAATRRLTKRADKRRHVPAPPESAEDRAQRLLFSATTRARALYLLREERRRVKPDPALIVTLATVAEAFYHTTKGARRRGTQP